MDTKRVANGLGWFSIGLGTLQLVAPDRLGRAIGVGEHAGLMRTMGLREIATGVAVLAQQQPKAGLWSRVAGDALDLTLLARALPEEGDGRARVLGAAGMVLAVGVVDYLCARNA